MKQEGESTTMARYLRYAGLASIVVVDDDKEIDALLDRPELDRTYDFVGPLLNRLMISELRRALFRDGRPLLSFAPRGDTDRAAAQEALAKRLDALAEDQPWSGDAIAAMASYIATGTDRDGALAALTYAMAYPFLAPGEASRPFEAAKFARLFAQFEVLQSARSSWKGRLFRILGADKRATQEILQTMNGEDYGLHAVGITLANSVPILDHVRALFADPASDRSDVSTLDWSKVRVAPVAVTRQNIFPCPIPGIAGEIPANSLILFKMRDAQRLNNDSGFEFASAHWSFCPARRYVESIFAAAYRQAKHGV
jgi:hypothetical protein